MHLRTPLGTDQVSVYHNIMSCKYGIVFIIFGLTIFFLSEDAQRSTYEIVVENNSCSHLIIGWHLFTNPHADWFHDGSKINVTYNN